MFWLLVAIVFQLALSGRLPVYVGLVKPQATSTPIAGAPVAPPAEVYRPDLP